MGRSTYIFGAEVLESRRLLSTVYVSSSSGSDGNSGLSSGSPVKTFAKAKSLLHDFSSDQMLLKAGDVFNGGIGAWKLSGKSGAPIVIGSYGSGAHPLIKSGTAEGIVTYGSSGHSVDNVTIRGIDFIASTYNGRNGSFKTMGIRLTRQGTNWLVENCRIEGYKDNISLDADGSGINKFTLRKSQILNSYATSSTANGHSQGIYLAGGTKNTTIEDCTFDHNGWKEGVSGAGPTMYNHNIYINTGVSGTIIRRNVISRASLCGITIRSGGRIEDNLITGCPVGIKPSASGTVINHNVIINGIDLKGSSGGAAGIDVTPGSGITISNNIIAHEKSGNQYHVTGIRLENGVKNASVFSNVIYDWQQAINVGSGSGITVKNNELSSLTGSAPLIAQVSGANPSSYHYSGNIYSTPKTNAVNQIALSNKSFSQWVSATKETGAKATTLRYADPTRNVSITSLTSKVKSISTSVLSMLSYIRAGFGKS